jgi:hypothetical protein
MRFFRIISAIFREIFDETAYDRFCAREGFVVGRNSYAKFLRDRDSIRQPKVRCC